MCGGGGKEELWAYFMSAVMQRNHKEHLGYWGSILEPSCEAVEPISCDLIRGRKKLDLDLKNGRHLKLFKTQLKVWSADIRSVDKYNQQNRLSLTDCN